MKTTQWTPKNVMLAGSGLLAALLVIPNLGKGIDQVVYLARTPSVAYAAKEQAEQVDTHFQQYLARQEAYTEALQQVITQQQEQPSIFQETDQEGVCWVCTAWRYDECWAQSLWQRCP